MASSPLSHAADFVAHLNTALPLSKSRVTVSPKLWGGNLAGALTEVSANAPGRVEVVMLSSPEFTDKEFDDWVGTVQAWSRALPDQTRGAFAREIKIMKHVDDGIPLSRLHKEMPTSLLFTYRQKGDFVVVIEPPGSARRIFVTKGIG